MSTAWGEFTAAGHPRHSALPANAPLVLTPPLIAISPDPPTGTCMRQLRIVPAPTDARDRGIAPIRGILAKENIDDFSNDDCSMRARWR